MMWPDGHGLARYPVPLVTLSLACVFVGLVELVSEPGIAAFEFATLVLALAVVSLASWRAAGWTGEEPFDQRVLDAGLLGLAYMALAGLLLGTLGILAWWSLLLLTGIGGLALALAVPGGHGERSLTLAWPGLPVALALAFGAFAAVQAVGGRILRPPVGDPLAYHLPFAVEWLQRGDLHMPVPPAGDPSTPFYPLNSSLWIFWLLAPVESEILARFVQLPFLLLLGLAAFRLARELGVPPGASALTGALIVSVPDVARSASLPENDLIIAALLVTATASLARLNQRFTAWRALLAALAIGLAVGVKVIAVAYGALPGVIWLAIVLVRGRSGGWWRVLGIAAGGAAVVLLVGSYSYLRNAVVMDNPLYPAGYRIAGRLLFDGLYFPTWEWRRSHAFFPYDWAEFLTGARGVFGLTVTTWALPGFGLAGAALAVALAGRRGTRRERLWQPVVLLALVPLSLAVFWFVIPYHFDRFLFAPLAWGVVAGMWGLGWWWNRLAPARLSQLYPYLTVPLILYNLVNVPLDPAVRQRASYWLAALVVIGGVPLALALLPRLNLERRRLLPGIAAAGLMLLAIAAYPRYDREYAERRYDEWRAQIAGFNQQTDAWEWLAAQTADAPATVAVAGTNEVYPLYGPGLDNRLVTIWHSGELAGYGWGAPFVLYGEPDRAAWEARIEREGVDYVVITENVSFGGWPVERGWLAASGGRFELAFQNADIEIWARVEPVAGWQALY